MAPIDEPDVDYRFSLANERTLLAWLRTALALLAGGVAAAKAIEFDSELWRWIVSGPPITGGIVLAATSVGRWRRFEEAMRAGRRLPTGHAPVIAGLALAVYGVVVLVALAVD